MEELHEDWRLFFGTRYVAPEPVLTAADYDVVPRFTFVEEPPGELLRRLLGSLLLLAVLPLVLGVAGGWAARRPGPAA